MQSKKRQAWTFGNKAEKENASPTKGMKHPELQKLMQNVGTKQKYDISRIEASYSVAQENIKLRPCRRKESTL